MANSEFEIEAKLTENYADELEELMATLLKDPGSWAIQDKVNQKLQIFEKHLDEMKRNFPKQDDKLKYWRGLIHDMRGREKLAKNGLVGEVTTRTAFKSLSSDDTSKLMTGVLFAILASNQAKKKAADSIPLFTKAIEVYPAYRFFWHRASSYEMTGQYHKALEDLEVLTEEENPFYLDARKMKNEILQKLATSEKKETDRCFIATSIYGSLESEQVLILRQFRDSWLLPKYAGKKFVEFYYRCSPPIARMLDKSKFLKTIARIVILDPLVALICKITEEVDRHG